MIVGLVRADAGQLWIDGKAAAHMPIHQRARLGLGYLPQENSIFRKMTVEENIQAVFVENVNDARLLEQLGRETGLHIKGKLYSDALSSDAPDYFSFYRHNVDLLVQTLQH